MTAAAAPGLSEDFIAMAAHELRGPATVIAGAAETLQSLLGPDDLGPEATDLLAMLVRSGRRLRKLAVDVLSSVYLERGELPLAMDRLPLLPIIGWAIDAGGSDRVDVHVDVTPNSLPTSTPITSNGSSPTWCRTHWSTVPGRWKCRPRP